MAAAAVVAALAAGPPVGHSKRNCKKMSSLPFMPESLPPIDLVAWLAHPAGEEYKLVSRRLFPATSCAVVTDEHHENKQSEDVSSVNFDFASLRPMFSMVYICLKSYMFRRTCHSLIVEASHPFCTAWTFPCRRRTLSHPAFVPCNFLMDYD